MHLYLITHAHTEIDSAAESRQWRLSRQGEHQATILAGQPWWRQTDVVALSSEAKTALTVAPLLAQYPRPVVVDARFDELYRPGWVADYESRVRQALAYPQQAAGDWEPATATLQRFLAGLAALCAQYPQKTLALVGHGLSLSLYRAHLLGRTHVNLADWRRLSFAAVALVEPMAGRLVCDFAAIAGEMPRTP
jgi:broad specificity phosphatase PhoE